MHVALANHRQLFYVSFAGPGGSFGVEEVMENDRYRGTWWTQMYRCADGGADAVA